MIRKLLAAVFLAVVLMVPACATAAPLDDLPAVTIDQPAAPAADSPMLASVGVLGVAGVVAGKSLLSFRPGDRVTYVDEKGKPHPALVTHWWSEHDQGACNLVYVDPEKRDSYGHERELVSSVSRGLGSAPGRYWKPAEEPVTAEIEAAPIPAPPPVAGYRQLTPEDVALMNEVKAATNALGIVLDKLAAHPDTDKRWMAACRAITKPSSFA